MRSPCLAVCLAAACLLAAAGPAPADPPQDVSQADVRARLTAYLRDRPAALAAVAQRVGAAVRVDPAGVEYAAAADGTPVRLVLRYQVDVALTPAQQKELAVALAALLDDALGQYTGGPTGRPLLSPDAFTAVRKVYAFEPGAVAAPAVPPAEALPYLPAQTLPPPPMPMAGRVFPAYPIYPLRSGPVQIAYGGETFASADWTGYWLYAAPVAAWYYPSRVTYYPHPTVVETATRRPPPRAEQEPAAGFEGVAGATPTYDTALAAFWAGDYARARGLLTALAPAAGRDARVWAYLALAAWALGDDPAAAEAARYGAAVALVYPDENFGLAGALERVQGGLRRRLSAAAADLTPEDARALVARKPLLSQARPSKAAAVAKR